MREFQCEDSETLEETRDKIVASMDAMLQDLDTPGEGKKAVLARIGRMRLK